MSTNRPLQIALVSDAVLPFHKGGKETRIDHLARALVSLGHDVHIFTMKWWDEPAKTKQINGITYHAISRLYPLYHGKRRSFKEGILFGLACLKMLRHNWDILEADHMPYFPLFSLKFVNLFKRKPFYATWHEAVGLSAWRDYIGYPAGTIAYVLEHLAVRMPDHIIPVSERTRDLLRSELGYKGLLTLVPNGIDYPTIAAAKVGSEKTDVVFAGRLVRHKRVDLMLDAVAILKNSRPNIRVAIVGGGPELERLKAQVAHLKLEKNVVITGRLEHSSDVYSYMKASKVFVSPSTREGFGITILEAYACGLRPVTVRHRDNAAQYLVRENAGAVTDLNAEALAAGIESQLKVRGKLNIDGAQFDWSRSVDALKEAYRI